MPIYAYRCRVCADSFEVNRPMNESNAAATCPDGHQDTVRLLTTVQLTGSTPPPAPTGGCCGGACGCG